MNTILAYNWWLLTIRGVCAVLLGLVAFAYPGITWSALTAIFAVYAVADGFLALTAGYRRYRNDRPWGGMLLVGVLGLMAGVVAIALPAAATLAVLYTIAGWAVAHGVVEIIAALRLRKVLEREWALLMSGIASVLFGVMVAFYPGVGLIALTALLSALGFAYGALLISASLKLRSLQEVAADRVSTPVAGDERLSA